MKKWLKFSAWISLALFLFVGAVLCFVNYDYFSDFSKKYPSSDSPSVVQAYGYVIGIGLALFSGFIATTIMSIVTILPDKKENKINKENKEKKSNKQKEIDEKKEVKNK